MGGVGCPPTVLPPCPGHAYVRSASAWPSMSPSSYYTPQLGSALALPFLENPSCLYWSCCHRRLRCPPALVPVEINRE